MKSQKAQIFMQELQAHLSDFLLAQIFENKRKQFFYIRNRL